MLKCRRVKYATTKTCRPTPCRHPFARLLPRLLARTEQAYVQWYIRFVHFHKLRHSGQMGRLEVEAFLTHLAVVNQVSASIQNQALSTRPRLLDV
jgi:hypothetical protein